MPNGRHLISLSMAGAVLLFVLLSLLDFPKPMEDDLFYSGASLNLAGGGDFANPLLVRQNFPSHLFFVYPPLHAHALAGWMSLFGVNTASLLAFQAVCCAVATCATIVILRRHDAPAIFEWLALPGITAAFLPVGLRPEPFAVALTLAGFAVGVAAGGRRTSVLFAAFLLMFLGASVAPRIAPFSVTLIACAAMDALFEPGADRVRWGRVLIAGAAALLVTALVFSVMIHFRFGEFLHTFRLHASRVTESRAQQLKNFLRAIVGVRQWPLLAAALLLLVLGLRRLSSPLARIGCFVAAGFPLGAVVGGLGHGCVWFASMIVLLFGAVAARELAGKGKCVFFGVLIAVFLFANAPYLVLAGGILSGTVHGPEQTQSSMLALRPTAQHPLLIDSSTARYLYDYRLPAGVIDWSFAAPFPGTLATDTQLNAADLFLVGPPTVDLLNHRTRLNQPADKWVPFGLKRWANDRHPREAFLIKASACQ